MPTELPYPLLVVFVGYVVFGITGFGSALLIVPLLALRLPLQDVVPLVLLLDLVASAQLGQLNFSAIRFAELWRLIPALVPGAVLGLYLANWGSHPALLLALGVYIASVGLSDWRRTPGAVMTPLGSGWAWPYGLGSGLIEALFGTSGPLIVAYLSRRLSDAQALRSTIASGIFIIVLLTLGGMAAVGRLSDPALWQRLPWLLMTTVVGCWLGHRIALRIAPERVKHAIYLILVVSGLAMCIHALSAAGAL